MGTIDPVLEKKVNELKKQLRTVRVDNKTFYVAEGDLLVEESKLADYIPRAANVQPPSAPAGGAGGGLLGIVEDGKIVRWPQGVVLTYRVVASTFDQNDEVTNVRENMAAATRDWEAICDVAFRGVTDETSEVLFSVRKHNARGIFIAASFFPNDPPDRRNLLIDPSYFTPSLGFNTVGVLRHELGHILGFRHEHIRTGAPPSCPSESLDSTIDLTKYDPQSVMHYFCGGVGDPELRITALDIEGAQKVYGRPRAGARSAA